MSLDPLALRSLIQQWRESARRIAREQDRGALEYCDALTVCADDLEAVLARSGEPSQVCPECEGKGQVLDAPARVLDGRAAWETCPVCQGAASHEPRS
jgi:hypothetical protein